MLEVGPGVTSVKPGDHVSASFVPSCGRCRYCSTGRQNLCDLGAGAFAKGMITDGTSRHRIRGEELILFAKLGTFSEHTVVAEASVIKVDDDLPARGRRPRVVRRGHRLGLGGEAGRHAARRHRGRRRHRRHRHQRRAGRHAWPGAKRIIAVDPVEFKREKAMEFGATHTSSIDGRGHPARHRADAGARWPTG